MNKAIPIYRVIEKDLRVAILEGKLKQGDMIPSETELCAKYKVSRMTVRQAINNLLVDGYIYSHKGRGTFVTFNKLEFDSEQENTPYLSVSKEMIYLGTGPVETGILSISIEKADEIIAKRLQLQIDDDIYYIERIRSCDNKPLVYERIYLPINMYKNFDESYVSGSFYDFVKEKLGFNIGHGECSIEARALNQKVADILHQTAGEPSLYMSSTTFLDNGRAFIYLRQYFHANYFRIKHRFKN